jgi:hypothetical protein
MNIDYFKKVLLLAWSNLNFPTQIDLSIVSVLGIAKVNASLIHAKMNKKENMHKPMEVVSRQTEATKIINS